MPASADALAAIDSRAAGMEAQLIRWADLNSGSHNTSGLLQMGSSIAQRLRELGAEVHLLPLPDADAPAVVARKRPQASRRVLLSGHFDTVYSEADRFQSCDRPEPDVIRGPGVADMKGGIVVMLEALRALEASDASSELGWEALLTPDEEVGSPASMPLLREAAKRSHLAIVFEPALSDGSIVSTRKGVGVVRVFARGRAAHAGRNPAEGRNAIVALAHFISAVNFLNHALSDVVVNAGSIKGGGAINIVPDRATAEFNIRALRAADGDEILRRMRDAAEAVGRANEVEFEITGGFTRRAMETTPESARLIEAWCEGAARLGFTIGAGHSGGGSDGNILAEAGLPCIDGAGVEGFELHSDREWMRASSLPRRAKVAAQFLLRLARGEIE